MTQAAPLATPDPSGAPAAPVASLAPAAPAEKIERPDPGLARGHWEAPRWAFALIAALTVAGGLVWLAITLRTRKTGS